MPRIKIILPPSFLFSTLIPVRITDVNYGGHVGNDSILSLIHEARVQFLSFFGWTELNMAGVGLIMSDVGIEFKNELFYGHTLKIYVTADDFSRAGFDIYYKMTSVIAGNETIIAIAKTGMVAFNYSTKKVVAVPEEVKSKLISP
ncbi:MAG: thioesterase family protein [Chitinophagaceae bacterium]